MRMEVQKEMYQYLWCPKHHPWFLWEEGSALEMGRNQVKVWQRRRQSWSMGGLEVHVTKTERHQECFLCQKYAFIGIIISQLIYFDLPVWKLTDLQIFDLGKLYLDFLIKNNTYQRCPKFNVLTMKRQWTYGPTLLPWFDHFHTSLACFTAL